MEIVICVIVILLHGIYTFLESTQLLVRVAGADRKKNAIGATLEKAVMTVKRVPLVIIPPLLGVLSLGNFEKQFIIMFACSIVFGGFTILVTIYSRSFLISKLTRTVDLLAGGASVFKSLAQIFNKNNPGKLDLGSLNIWRRLFTKGALNYKVVVLSMFVYGLIGSSPFIVNYVALKIPMYSSVLVQLTGLINAVAVVLLSFFLDPIVSRSFETQDEKARVDLEYLIGMFAGHTIVSTSAFTLSMLLT